MVYLSNYYTNNPTDLLIFEKKWIKMNGNFQNVPKLTCQHSWVIPCT